MEMNLTYRYIGYNIDHLSSLVTANIYIYLLTPQAAREGRLSLLHAGEALSTHSPGRVRRTSFSPSCRG